MAKPDMSMAPLPDHDDLVPKITKVEALRQPLLSQVVALEDEAFPACERLGPVLLQHQASLRTAGLLLAQLSASVCGYLLFARTGSAGLITKLAVSPAFRRRGIGASLLRRGIEELERPARRQGASEIHLHVDPTREGACRLYEACGFQRVSLLQNYYSDERDALLMRRTAASCSSSQLVSAIFSGDTGPATNKRPRSP